MTRPVEVHRQPWRDRPGYVAYLGRRGHVSVEFVLSEEVVARRLASPAGVATYHVDRADLLRRGR